MKTFFLFCILFLQGVALSSQPHIRALIVANTEEEGIGGVHDISAMKNSLTVIGKKIGYAVSTSVVKGRDFKADSVIQELRHMSLNSDDIAVFYYTGHGFNDLNSKSRWPTMCTFRHNIGKTLAGRAVIKFFRKKSNRLTLILFDCCNTPHTCRRIIRHIGSKRFCLHEEEDLPGLEGLFLKTKGLVVSSATQVGEVGYASPFDGAFFTAGFLVALSEKCRSSTSWNEIFSATSSFTSDLTDGHQHCMFVHKP